MNNKTKIQSNKENNSPKKTVKDNTVEKGYNPLLDANFWVAFVLGGGPVILFLLSQGIIGHSTILAAVFLVVWEAWIIFQKGKKGSLIVGFLIALVIGAIYLYFTALS